MAMASETVRVRCQGCGINSTVRLDVQGKVLVLPEMRCLVCCQPVKVLSPWLKKIIDQNLKSLILEVALMMSDGSDE